MAEAGEQQGGGVRLEGRGRAGQGGNGARVMAQSRKHAQRSAGARYGMSRRVEGAKMRWRSGGEESKFTQRIRSYSVFGSRCDTCTYGRLRACEVIRKGQFMAWTSQQGGVKGFAAQGSQGVDGKCCRFTAMGQ